MNAGPLETETFLFWLFSEKKKGFKNNFVYFPRQLEQPFCLR